MSVPRYTDHGAPEHIPCDLCTGKAHEVTGRIVNIDRLRNSTNGNPRFAITLEFVTLGTISQTWNTATDHAFGYEIGNPGFRVGSEVTITVKRGDITAMVTR